MNICPLPDCRKIVDILELPSIVHDSTGISALSNVMSEEFVLSSPPIRMEGIEDTATQRAKSYLRCAKCSEELSSCLPSLSFHSISSNAPTKPLLCPICPSAEDLELFPVEQASRTAQKKCTSDLPESTEKSSAKKQKLTIASSTTDTQPSIADLGNLTELYNGSRPK
ncbi:11031_t:CDS:2 [Ambispora gerdemannii]|uniref:11031_t:CDS:1 n=1 Tax=Ambispora gerdemannii TaxID=144530 RepID=A0A9N9CTD3_9GLOM|nr:11031_t:CDS:2 [Ambispora gerdemannii]